MVCCSLNQSLLHSCFYFSAFSSIRHVNLFTSNFIFACSFCTLKALALTQVFYRTFTRLKKKKKSTFRLGILIHLGLFRIWKRGWTPRAFEETLVFVFANRGGVMLWAWIADLIISAVSMATKYICQSNLSLPSQRVHIHSNTQGDSLTTSITASYCTTR